MLGSIQSQSANLARLESNANLWGRLGHAFAFAWLLMLCSCATGRGVVEGLIFESQREIAIEGAVVTIRSLEGDAEEQFILTDINGRYRFEEVREGLNQVTVIKEGYSGELIKLADVVEDEDLLLDFRLLLIPQTVLQALQVRIVDQNGPVNDAIVDFYQGPCVGRSVACLTDLPEDASDLFYRFVSATLTDDSGTATLVLPVLEEFNEYLFEFRLSAPGHQNVIEKFVVNIADVPPSVEFFVPRL